MCYNEKGISSENLFIMYSRMYITFLKFKWIREQDEYKEKYFLFYHFEKVYFLYGFTCLP